MAGLFSSLSSAMTFSGSGDYSAIAKPGSDFNHLAPTPVDIVPSESPQLIQKLQVLPRQVGQSEACQMIEYGAAMEIAEMAAKDYVKGAKKTIDHAERIHGHQTELAAHAMSAQNKIAQRNADYAKKFMVDGYGRKKMAAGLFGTQKGLTGIQRAMM